jgi:hypothetical protein
LDDGQSESGSPYSLGSNTPRAQPNELFHQNGYNAASEQAEDDSAIRPQPSRLVDYLSHNWREEDIWASWRQLVSNRSAYHNGARLENVIWRSWMKKKNDLKTIDPAALNW